MPAVKLKKPSYSGMIHLLPEYCPRGCGTKMATNGELKWCSFVRCDYVVAVPPSTQHGRCERCREEFNMYGGCRCNGYTTGKGISDGKR